LTDWGSFLFFSPRHPTPHKTKQIDCFFGGGFGVLEVWEIIGIDWA
jgi:hypothetical protein